MPVMCTRMSVSNGELGESHATASGERLKSLVPQKTLTKAATLGHTLSGRRPTCRPSIGTIT